MLASEYKLVSATRGIVLIPFYVIIAGFLGSFAGVNAYAQNNINNPINGHSSLMGNKPSEHLTLQRQLYTYIHDSLVKTLPRDNANNEISVEIRAVDERINIPYCSQAYQFDTSNSPKGQSNVSVKVTCPDNNWYLFMHASVSVMQQVVVTSENLSPGSLLSSANTKIIKVDKNRLRGSTFSRIEEVHGARLKRRTRSGNVVDGAMLCFVCKGDRVTIAAIGSGLSIKVFGMAEQDGIVGDTIQVRNLSSDKLIFAKIASTSQVEIRI